jgi:hypothetical protein
MKHSILHKLNLWTSYYLAVIAILANAQLLYAEPKIAAIAPGMSIQDVIRLKGAPIEKIEREIKREEVWRYNDGEVTIRDQVVLLVVSNSDGFVNLPQDPAQAKTTPATKDSKKTGKTSREILAEIMRVYPDDGKIDTSPRSPISSAPAAAAPPLPPPADGIAVPPGMAAQVEPVIEDLLEE